MLSLFDCATFENPLSKRKNWQPTIFHVSYAENLWKKNMFEYVRKNSSLHHNEINQSCFNFNCTFWFYFVRHKIDPQDSSLQVILSKSSLLICIVFVSRCSCLPPNHTEKRNEVGCRIWRHGVNAPPHLQDILRITRQQRLKNLLVHCQRWR